MYILSDCALTLGKKKQHTLSRQILFPRMNRYIVQKGSPGSWNGNGTAFFSSELLKGDVRGTIQCLHQEVFRVTQYTDARVNHALFFQAETR